MKNSPYIRALWIIGGAVGTVLLLTYLLVLVESEATQSSIDSFENALWYVMSTITTVGYGDLFPTTLYGRIIGYLFLLLSLGVYGLFISKVTSVMSTVREHKHLGYGGTSFRQHSVILGWSESAQDVVDQLVGVSKEVVVVTEEIHHVDQIKDYYKNNRFLFVLHVNDINNLESLEKAKLSEAKVIFVNLANDMDNLVYVLNMRKFYPKQEYAVVLDRSDLKNAFYNAGVSHVVCKNELASKMLASYIFEPDVAQYSEDILSYAKDEHDYDIKEYRVLDSNPYLNREYGYAFVDAKRRYNAILPRGRQKEYRKQTRAR